MKKLLHFPDRNQNFWQLASIQSASQSIPSLLIGGVLAQQYSAEIAITSICIGNLILWLIGFGVISMAHSGRKNAIENVKGYLGKGSGLFMAIVLMVAFLAWYMLEIQSATTALTPIFSSSSHLTPGVLGIGLGITTAFLVLGGIRLIKWLCVASFPFLFFFALFSMFTSKHAFPFSGVWNFSFSASITVAALTLPGMINLPTFFRHSHSKSDSILALTLVTVFDAFFELFGLFTGMTDPSHILAQYGLNPEIGIYIVCTILFIILTLICLNSVNIYFAAASLEALIPSFRGPKGYVIVGLLGTAVYAFLQNSAPMIFLENTADNFISNLGVVLLVSFLIKTLIKHRPRTFEKTVSSTCWILGCIIALIMQIYHPQNYNESLLLGISASAIAFLCIFFIEETTWAMRELSILHAIRNIRDR